MKTTTKFTLHYYWQAAKKYKKLVLVMHTLMLISLVANLIWPILFGNFIDTATSNQEKDLIVKALIGFLGYFLIIETIDVLGRRFGGYLNDLFQPLVIKDVYDDCFNKMQKHSYNFFSNNFTGSLVKKVNKMTRGFEDIADRITWDLFPLAIRIIFITGMFFYINPVLGSAILIWNFLFMYINYKLAIYKMQFDEVESSSSTLVTGRLADNITNSTNIKLFAGLKDEHKGFKKVTHNWRLKAKKAWNIGSHIELGQSFFMVLIELVVLYISIKLWQKDIISIGSFALIMFYMGELFHQLWGFGRVVRDIFRNLADAEEMTEILMLEPEVKDHTNKRIQIRHGKIEFKNVNFAYNQNEQVISNMNLTIKPSEKIALIGPSGGGKSTIVKLLLRLFDTTEGQILIDGQNTADFTQDSLHEQITLVPQDPILFHRTLMENIRYGRRDASDKEVIAAAKLAHCHKFIQQFQDGYQTYVGERGVKLSGGQRQRVAIARAILSNSKILILDEATSSLDSEAETVIQDALENLIKNKTTIIIAHRLSTIMKTDRILVLKDGTIVEEGTHADLVDKSNSLYKKLWDLQVGGYL
jgi:ATP-binding cassette subfamily B protein